MRDHSRPTTCLCLNSGILLLGILASTGLTSRGWALEPVQGVGSPRMDPMDPVKVTGMELVVDPQIAPGVRTLGLQDRISMPYSRELVLEDVDRIQDLGTVARVLTDVQDHQRGKKLFYRIEANPRISSLRIVGNRLMSAAEILGSLESREGEILDYRKLYSDANRIAKIHQDRDFMYVQVDRKDHVRVTGSRVTLKVTEYRLGGVTLTGLEGPRRRLALAALGLRRGEPIRRSVFLAALHDIYRLPFVADLDFEPRFESGSDQVHLHLVVEPVEEPVDEPVVISRTRSPSTRG